MRLPLFLISFFTGLFFCVPCVDAKGNPRTKTVAAEATPPAASQPDLNGTAEEYLSQAARALSQSRWKEASDAYSAYSRDFGGRPETEAVAKRFQPAFALALLHQNRFQDALAPLQRALNANPPLSPALRQELQFQEGLCMLSLGDYQRARASLEQFLTFCTAGPQFQQAHLLLAQTELLSGNPAEAAERLKASRPLLDSFHAPQALLQEIRTRIEAGQLEPALALVQKEKLLLQDSFEAVGFQNTLLRLASHLLEQGQFRNALIGLYQIRPFQTILEFAESQLLWIEKEGAGFSGPSAASSKAMLKQSGERIRLELQTLKECGAFDAAVLLRVAAAYQGLQRFREAALILTQAIQKHPSEPSMEQAGISIMQLWSELECWSHVDAVSTLFCATFSKPQNLPTVLFLKGVAHQKERHFAEALKTFETIVRVYPKSDIARRAELMRAFTLLMSGDANLAALQFAGFLKQSAKHELAEEAAHWLCVAYAVGKQPEKCRTAAAEYLARYPDGPNRSAVLFQNARAAHAQHDYALAITELGSLLETFPEDPKAGEAHLLLAEAQLATEDTEPALTTLQNIPTSNPAAFEEGWFKAAKLLKTLGRSEQIASHLERFAQQRLQSPRYSDAVLWACKWWIELGQSEASTRLAWEVITEHANDPNVPAVESLLDSLATLFAKAIPAEQRTSDLRLWATETTAQAPQGTAALRAQWGLARALSRTSPLEAQQLLLTARLKMQPHLTSDRILSDIAEACTSSGQATQAALLWREMLKWHPRSVLKDRALAALMLEAEQSGEPDKALQIACRFERECADSPLSGRVGLSKALIQEANGDRKEAEQSLQSVLLARGASGEFKSEALLLLAENQMQLGKPKTAIPYYQRVYVMYGRWKKTVAKAYLRSGEAFEKLGDKTAARRTYREMREAGLPAELPEMAQADHRLALLGEIE